MGHKWISIMFFLFTLEGCHAEICQDTEDPCGLDRFVDFPYMDTRHPSIGYTQATSDVTKYCDLYALNPGVWYGSTYNMTTVSVRAESCGTKYPIWVNGSIPSFESGVNDRTACVRTYDSNCHQVLQLRLKNCLYYTVYCLLEIPSTCPLRYCFDVDLSKVTTTTTTTTTTKTTTPKPTTSVLPGTAEEPRKSKDYSSVSIVLICLLAVTIFTICGLAYVVVTMKKKLSTVHSPIRSPIQTLHTEKGCLPTTYVLPAQEKI